MDFTLYIPAIRELAQIKGANLKKIDLESCKIISRILNLIEYPDFGGRPILNLECSWCGTPVTRTKRGKYNPICFDCATKRRRLWFKEWYRRKKQTIKVRPKSLR